MNVSSCCHSQAWGQVICSVWGESARVTLVELFIHRSLGTQTECGRLTWNVPPFAFEEGQQLALQLTLRQRPEVKFRILFIIFGEAQYYSEYLVQSF